MRGIALGLLLGALITGCAARSTKNTDALYLTKYTLAQCLRLAYPNTPVDQDALVASGNYLEHGTLGEDAYEEAVDLAEKTVAKKYVALVDPPQPLHVAKCIDLIGSPELDQLIKRHVR